MTQDLVLPNYVIGRVSMSDSEFDLSDYINILMLENELEGGEFKYAI